jgi:hypothetical protein
MMGIAHYSPSVEFGNIAFLKEFLPSESLRVIEGFGPHFVPVLIDLIDLSDLVATRANPCSIITPDATDTLLMPK